MTTVPPGGSPDPVPMAPAASAAPVASASADRLLPYQYVVLRCVPRVEREEFVNVGVVLYCQEADYLGCAWRLDEPRLRALAPGLDLAALRAALATADDVCAGRQGGGLPRLGRQGARFGWLAAPRSTILQPGPVHGGASADPRAEAVRLVDVLVR